MPSESDSDTPQEIEAGNDGIEDSEAGAMDTGAELSVEADTEQERVNDCLWVGIGASAGGLESITSLCKELPAQAPAIYIVAQHLSPKHRSMLSELVQRKIELRVKTITSDTIPVPNTIYITPPQRDVIVKDGHIILQKASDEIIPKPSVNTLFNSLAEYAKDHAVGIVLSGTGSDGAVGIKAIRAAGGITFAEVSSSAKYSGMPDAARETQCIDYVLDPTGIAKQLGKIANHLFHGGPKTEEQESDTDWFERLFIAVQRETGLSFKQYKKATLKRRIERRMLAVGKPNIEDYVELVESDAKEAKSLFKEILISVTNFFRDREAFEAIEGPLKEKLEKIPRGESLRIWSVGCATGEEPFSLAMQLAEILGSAEALAERNVRIFATDVDEQALAIARKGRYAEATLLDVPPKFVKRYFEKKGDSYEVVRPLRDAILFATHNIIEDPPFQRIDLLICRNLLIYFEPNLQERIYNVFHYSLRDGGLLFLGRSESTTHVTSLFRNVDTKNKVFQKRASAISRLNQRYLTFKNLPSHRRKDDPSVAENLGLLQESLIRQLGEAAILIDESLNIERIFGDATPFLSITDSRPTWTLPEIVGAKHRQELKALCYKCLKSGKVEEGMPKPNTHRGESVTTRLRIYPLKGGGDNDRFLLVCFTIGPAPSDQGPEGLGTESTDEKVAILEDELAAAREHLQTVIEELETSNEELQSTNEELQSSNEELQSSNEELETTNEELQSTNEELVTTNDELQSKSSELEQTSSQLMNIKNSLVFPLILIDLDKNILRANRKAREFFGSSQSPENLGSFGKIRSTEGSLSDVITKVFDSNSQKEVGVTIGELYFTVHVTPFRGPQDRLEGAILSFIDITEQNRRERELEEAKVHAEAASYAKAEFLANMSHEIRTPLHAICGIAELLTMSTNDPERMTRLLKVLNNSSQSLKVLLDDILDFSKLEAGQVKLDSTTFSLREVLAEVMGIHSVEADEKKLELKSSVAPSLPDKLIGDPVRFKQIISNLLSNAVKFTSTGSVEVEIAGKLAGGAVNLKIAVKDTGIGMSEEDERSIFDKFTQAEEGTTRKFGGTGLGLAIVREICDLMGGEVTVESSLNEGSTFTAHLKFDVSSHGAKLDTGDSGDPIFSDTEKAREGRILLVEDNRDNQYLASLMLEDLGCRCDIAANIEEAFAAISLKSYAVILLDLQLGTESGFDFFERYQKEYGKSKDIATVIALTAHVHQDIMDKCLNAGMRAFLTKPLDSATLKSELIEVYKERGIFG